MNEFSLIDAYFKPIEHVRKDVVLGIGDDAACLQIPHGMQLLVSTDTLVADVHFHSTWDPFDIAYKAVMVNVSDIAAMGGTPCWITLALTLPELDKKWLHRFSQGLQYSLAQYNIALVGGDTTRGPLSMTVTVHGLVDSGKAIRRSGAQPGDKIFVTGELGGAALAVAMYGEEGVNKADQSLLEEKLIHPLPRVDFTAHLQKFATAAIDISDGLSADLNHICEASRVGACLNLDKIPIHPVVKKNQGSRAIDFALNGGDDYELCFTIAPVQEESLLKALSEADLSCYLIGTIKSELGLQGVTENGGSIALQPQGYNHFKNEE